MQERSQSAPKRRHQFTVRLSGEAVAIAEEIAGRHGLRSRAQAIEYALRATGRAEGVAADLGESGETVDEHHTTGEH